MAFGKVIFASLVLLCTNFASAQIKQTNILEQIDACSRSCSSDCVQLAETLQKRLDILISNCETEAAKLTLNKEAYKYAYSPYGLYASVEESKAFATLIAKQRRPEEALKCYKEVREESRYKAKMSENEAQKQAEKICKILR